MLTQSSNSKKADTFISVIVPCFNVASMVSDFLAELYDILEKNYLFFEIVCIDDGSSDQTVKKISSLLKVKTGMRLIELSHPHGADNAACVGMMTAIGDYVVTLDIGDSPIELLPSMIQIAKKESAIVYGIKEGGRYQLSARHAGATLFAWYCRKYLKIDIQRGSGLLRVFPRSAANAILSRIDRNRSLRILSATLGFPLVGFQYHPSSRHDASEGASSFFDGMDMAFDLLASASRHPLRWMSRLAVMVAGLNVLYAIYIVAIYFFKKDVAAGWVTLSMQQAGMFFLLFLVLTVLSEYLGRLLLEIQKAPTYTIKAESSSSVIIDEAEKINVYRSEK